MPSKTYSRDQDDDPLTRAIAPPPDETAEETEARLLSEQEAKRVSDAIDEEINRQRIAKARKLAKIVKVLLLGQSESGKSTTLKNLQLMNSPKAFHFERASWRAVIQLNIVRSIRIILDALTDHHAACLSPKLSADLLKLKLRLSPLLQVEDVLVRKLMSNDPERPGAARNEVVVSSTAAWKGAYTRLVSTVRGSPDNDGAIDWDDPNDPGVVLHACGEDMKQLWTDPVIKAVLVVQKLRLEDMAGFFLDCLDRVTSARYIPSDDDILKARLKTLGVSEHHLNMRGSNVINQAVTHDWIVYDVGGQRSLVSNILYVSAWVPFFDDVDAIIFLAPISAFDQVLTEDESVNRLHDSIKLWESIQKNPLLKRTEFILFLNKCDLFKAKLASGIRLAKYVISYGDRPNEYESATDYLKRKFRAIQKEHSPVRVFHCHLTSVTDMASTKRILSEVQDLLIRQNLKTVALFS